MKAILTTLIVTLALSAGAQCKFAVDKIDPFLKARHRETKPAPVSESGTSKTLFAFVRLGDSMAIAATHTSLSASGALISFDHPIVLLFDNDSTASLLPLGTYFAKPAPLGLGQIKVRYGANMGVLRLLAAVPLRSVRVFTSAGYVDADTKPKWRPKIQQAAACILEP